MKNIKKMFVMILGMLFSMNILVAGGIGRDGVSKEIQFEIAKDYEACSFEIQTEKTGNFNVYLFYGNSDNNAYNEVIENGNNCTIKVQDVKQGTWTVRVCEVVAENPVITQVSQEETTEDTEPTATPEPTADEVIGKIQVSAKAIDKTAFSIGNVTVARDIVGLTEYFKDESIVVEWTDTSCGNVNVTIIDTKTSQILDKQKIEGNYYEFEIPELVNEITVDIVPATSAGITGANTQITMPVINSPEAVITYENKEYTNRDTITVVADLKESYSLLFMNNSTEVKESGIIDAGTHEFEIPITEGVNQLLTYVVDDKHNMRSTPYTIVRDSIKPALTLSMEYDGAATYDDVAYIQGTIKDYDTFTINQVEPIVTGDGSFTAEYLLNVGVNVLEIKATDLAGNETIYTAEISKLVKETPNWLVYVPPGLFIILIIVAIIYKKKKGNDDKPSKPEKEPKPERKEMKATNNKFELNKWQKNLIGCVVTFVLTFVFFKTVILWGVVPSESMQPTLNVSDAVIVNGLAYVRNEPARGDIIVFKGTEGDMVGKTIVKRIIGVPGDNIMFVDGYIYINGELCYEEYLEPDIETNSFKDFEVPENGYFVLGDNRNNSHDSRYWTNPYVSREAIKGKVMTAIPVSKLVQTVQSIF